MKFKIKYSDGTGIIIKADSELVAVRIAKGMKDRDASREVQEEFENSGASRAFDKLTGEVYSNVSNFNKSRDLDTKKSYLERLLKLLRISGRVADYSKEVDFSDFYVGDPTGTTSLVGGYEVGYEFYMESGNQLFGTMSIYKDRKELDSFKFWD